MVFILCLNFKVSSPFPVNSKFDSGRREEHNNTSNWSRKNVAALSSHSNARIIKTNRRSPYGDLLSPYSDNDDDSEETHHSHSRFSSDDEFADMEDFNMDSYHNQKKPKLQTNNIVNYGRGVINSRRTRNFPLSAVKVQETGFINGSEKLKNGQSTKSRFHGLFEDLDFDEKWLSLIDYLSTFGLKESHFILMYERHMPCLKLNLDSAQERLEFLMSVGVKHSDIKRILLRQPQILEYTVENNLKSHVKFLESLGIPHSRVGQVIKAAPSLFSYSVDNSLKPTIRYLVEEVGIKTSDVSKVVQLSPQILVQRIDRSWTSRFNFLSEELDAPRDSIVKMVTKHPQLLHYSIEDGILPRINFLRSIGMRNSDILKVLTSLTQVLSLSLEENLKPKYLYLVNELRNEVQSLTKYPTYLSLSLEQRIRPRHRFLVSLKKAPRGPFPLSSLVPTDECFCQHWAGTSLEKYIAFRQSLLLSNFAKKYDRKG